MCNDGTGGRDDACGGHRCDENRAGDLRAMPRLEEWERQAEHKKRSPIGEKHAGLANLEDSWQSSGHEDQQSDLGAPKHEIRKPQ